MKVKQFCEQLEDLSLSITLSDGTRVILRDPSVGDMEVIQRSTGDDDTPIYGLCRLIAILCEKWGDLPGITVAELTKPKAVRFADLSYIERQVKTYFLPSMDE